MISKLKIKGVMLCDTAVQKIVTVKNDNCRKY